MNRQHNLLPHELDRYQRQIMLSEVGTEGQERLKNARVLVVGAGGLGSPVLQYLSAAGVGRIGVVDSDRVELSNLQRQVLYCESNQGMSKAREAVSRLCQLNSGVLYDCYEQRLSLENALNILAPYDIVVDCSDNFLTRYLINDACVKLDLPFVGAAISGFAGQLGVFNALDPRDNASCNRSATYRCLFPKPPSSDQSLTCEEAGVLGVLPGIMGTLQANEVLKLILGLGPLTNRLLVFDALALSWNLLSFSLRPDLIAEIKYAPLREESDCCQLQKEKVRQINAVELKLRLDRGEDIELIDVREAAEKKIKDIGGKLMPLGQICSLAHHISRDKPVVLYCQSGARSQRACKRLEEDFGFTNLLNLEGGLAGLG